MLQQRTALQGVWQAGRHSSLLHDAPMSRSAHLCWVRLLHQARQLHAYVLHGLLRLRHGQGELGHIRCWGPDSFSHYLVVHTGQADSRTHHIRSAHMHSMAGCVLQVYRGVQAEIAGQHKQKLATEQARGCCHTTVMACCHTTVSACCSFCWCCHGSRQMMMAVVTCSRGCGSLMSFLR